MLGVLDGLAKAIEYAYAFIYFTGTVLHALVQGIRDWSALHDALGPWVELHGVLMVAAGPRLLTRQFARQRMSSLPAGGIRVEG